MLEHIDGNEFAKSGGRMKKMGKTVQLGLGDIGTASGRHDTVIVPLDHAGPITFWISRKHKEKGGEFQCEEFPVNIDGRDYLIHGWVKVEVLQGTMQGSVLPEFTIAGVGRGYRKVIPIQLTDSDFISAVQTVWSEFVNTSLTESTTKRTT